MAKISPTAVILGGPFCLRGFPFHILFYPGAMIWLKALNFRVCPSQQSWEAG